MISDVPTQFAHAVSAGHAGARQSGRTTATALFAVSWAMANPKNTVEIQEFPNTLAHREYLSIRIMEVITLMGLRGFVLTKSSRGVYLEYAHPANILTGNPDNAESSNRSNT